MTAVWITKYALTAGIVERELIEHEKGYVQVKEPRGLNGWALYHGNDFHLSKAAAVARANKMRLDKIASLKTRIAKLEKLSFA